MIVYGEREQKVNTAVLQREIELLTDETERLIRYGQWEAAVLDALCPEYDDVVDLGAQSFPEQIRIRPQEGFAYYALYPQQYAAAARQFDREFEPRACVVIGIRSIGTTLSTVVAGALPCPSWRFTVRPHGHPFDRQLKLSERLREEIRRHAGEWFLIVDEGPGLSGSSFISVAEALNELGIADDRIVFFPSHEPNPAVFVSERARARWPRHRRYVHDFPAADVLPRGARNLSGGLWRDIVPCDAAVQPSHERRKYLHDGMLWKFSGLGHYGRARLHRAEQLADFTPPVHGLQNGFLVTEFVDGIPAQALTEELLDAIAGYSQYLTEHCRSTEPVRYADLCTMVRVNTGIELPDSYPLIEDQSTTAIDGRMLPHEWLHTTDGRWLKADALDHHDDHFFPGCQDIAWDIAGAAVEFDVPANTLLDRLPPQERLCERVAFYTTAYLAYRIGYCSMAADALGDSMDGQRFRGLVRRYTAALEGARSRVTSRA